MAVALETTVAARIVDPESTPQHALRGQFPEKCKRIHHAAHMKLEGDP